MSKLATPPAKVVPAELDHIAWVAEHMREADAREVEASAGYLPFDALVCSFDASVHAWTGMIGDYPICMFGVSTVDFLAGIGCPWLLGTDYVERNAQAFLRRSKPYLSKMLGTFPRLINYVDARNELSIRWLRWLGADIDLQPVPYGVSRLPFYRFEIRSA